MLGAHLCLGVEMLTGSLEPRPLTRAPDLADLQRPGHGGRHLQEAGEGPCLLRDGGQAGTLGPSLQGAARVCA